MFERATFKDDAERESWRAIMSMDYVSSEESGEEDTLIGRPLPWLSAREQQFKMKLDSEIQKNKTPLGRRQMKSRVQGTPSKRPKPSSVDIPDWVFC